MEEKKNKPRQPQNGKVLLDPEPVASSTECTGLLSFMPRTADECAQYGEIYDIPLPVETVAGVRDVAAISASLQIQGGCVQPVWLAFSEALDGCGYDTLLNVTLFTGHR